MQKKTLIALLAAAVIAGALLQSVFSFATSFVQIHSARAFSLPDLFAQIQQRFKSLAQPSGSPVPNFQSEASPLPIAPNALAYQQQIEDVVARSNPSVVSITITKNVPVVEQYYVNPFQDFQGFGIQLPQDLLVPQYRQNGTKKQVVGGGSGFVISKDGLILTNKHVVADTSAEYTVFFNDGRKLPAQVLGRDATLDAAVLKVDAHDLVPLPIGNSDGLKLGQTVIAIGNSLGEFRNTVSVGVVSGLARTVPVENEILSNVIQTDAAINPGNSGGPLLDLSGQVIGMNTAMAQGAQSIGFAVPINQIKRVIQQAQTGGTISTAYLGVWYQPITQDTKDQLKVLVDSGALVSKHGTQAAVQKDSPADKAGIKEGDIIQSVNGQAIDQQHPLGDLIAQYAPGESITLRILRDGKTMDVQVTLAARP